MILVDTSVWINYFKGEVSARPLGQLLLENQIVSHPWVIGELMLGNLGAKRDSVLGDIHQLPKLDVHEIREIFDFVRKDKLEGKGLSLVDVQLLYDAIVSNCTLWTIDRKLHLAANRHGKAADFAVHGLGLTK